jgi:hypothetical protein
MARIAPEQAQQMLWNDLVKLYEDAQRIGRPRDADPSATVADSFMRTISAGRREGRLVGTIDRMMREARFGAVLDDPRHPEVLLEKRIVLAAKPYSFLWTQSMIDTARRRVRRFESS